MIHRYSPREILVGVQRSDTLWNTIQFRNLGFHGLAGLQSLMYAPFDVGLAEVRMNPSESSEKDSPRRGLERDSKVPKDLFLFAGR